MPPLQSGQKTQQGSILLEALIAFLIFSMGILGVIGLQATAINNTLEARYRSDAAFLANQIIAQMWADSPVPTTYIVKPTYACNPCTTNNGNGNANTQDWVKQIQGSTQKAFLPGVTNAVNAPTIAISLNKVTVTLYWKSPQNPKITHNYVTQTEIHFN
ncbi:MAG: pilus assembly protein PilV [Gallionella sp.]